MQKLSGLSEIASRYDGVLFDIYGVIHNGVACFDEAITCLERLNQANVPYGFLSNMPLRAKQVQAALTLRGMPEPLAKGALTSGEVVHRALSEPGFGKNYHFLGTERTREIVPSGYNATPLAEADFVLVSGIGDEDTPEDHQELLDMALARGLPMLCANPDLRVGHGDRLVSCAGLLVDAYERMGGDARWMGKPHKAVFAAAANMLGGEKLLMVGDSLRTDIAGAGQAGLDTVFIESGIHAEDFAKLGERLFTQYEVYPTFSLPHLLA